MVTHPTHFILVPTTGTGRLLFVDLRGSLSLVSPFGIEGGVIFFGDTEVETSFWTVSGQC